VSFIFRIRNDEICKLSLNDLGQAWRGTTHLSFWIESLILPLCRNNSKPDRHRKSIRIKQHEICASVSPRWPKKLADQKIGRRWSWPVFCMLGSLHATHSIQSRHGLGYMCGIQGARHTRASRSSTKPGSRRGSSMASTISTSEARWRSIGVGGDGWASRNSWPGSRTEQILVMSTKRIGGWRSC
jgi:hypothetical protein